MSLFFEFEYGEDQPFRHFDLTDVHAAIPRTDAADQDIAVVLRLSEWPPRSDQVWDARVVRKLDGVCSAIPFAIIRHDVFRFDRKPNSFASQIERSRISHVDPWWGGQSYVPASGANTIATAMNVRTGKCPTQGELDRTTQLLCSVQRWLCSRALCAKQRFG